MNSCKSGTLLRLASVSLTLLGYALPQERPIRSRGTIDVPQTYCFSLGDKTVSTTGQSCEKFDFWYEALHDKLRYLVPLGDVVVAIGGNKPAGYAGCLTADLSHKKIHFDHLANGTFVCARTSDGRYAEFSVVGLFEPPEWKGTLTLRLSYTIWER